MAYLGFVLTSLGILPGKLKLALPSDMEFPTNQQEVWAFISLCIFFQSHIKDSALIAQPQHRLTLKDVYQNGPINLEALKGFCTIKYALISKPVVAFPRVDRHFTLVSGIQVPSHKHEGGMSATLWQINSKGYFHVLANTS